MFGQKGSCMVWFCGECPKRKEECDFCKSILGDKAKLYANGECSEEYKPEMAIGGYVFNRELDDFMGEMKDNVSEREARYPEESERKKETYEAHYQVGIESFEEGEFELSMNFFGNILDYKDSKEYYKKATFAFEKEKRIVTEKKYNRAIALFNNAEIKQARQLFYEAEDYLDSRQRYNQLNDYINKKIRVGAIIIAVFIIMIIGVLIIF